MAARANLVINDGLAVPVAHTFNPNSGDGNVPGVSVISYEDRSGGVIVGFPVITVSTRKPSKQLKNHKLVLTIKVPVLDNLTNSTTSGILPAPSVAYDVMAKVEFILPERSTLPSRKDLLAYVKNFLANGLVTSAVHDLESPW